MFSFPHHGSINNFNKKIIKKLGDIIYVNIESSRVLLDEYLKKTLKISKKHFLLSTKGKDIKSETISNNIIFSSLLKSNK